MKKHGFLHKAWNALSVLLLVIVSLGLSRAADAQPALYQYANGLTLLAGEPLPIYKVITPTITSQNTLALSKLFEGIDDDTNLTLHSDEYLKRARFTGVNEKQQTLIEQFGATGGFYAYAPARAFGDGSVVPNPTFNAAIAQRSACLFLSNHQKDLLPASEDLEVPGLAKTCDHNFAQDPLYKVSTETRTGLSATPGAQTTNQVIRMMVVMPVLVNTGLHSQVPTIPLGGPGGHISMIFDDTTPSPNVPGPSLDNSTVGLQAVAMPAFGRSLAFSRNVPSVDPGVAREQVFQLVRASYPDGKNIQVPLPVLAYFVTDAAQPQTVLEPDLFFSGVTVDVDGQTHVFKDIILPATEPGPEGLGATVTILSPQDGDGYSRGKPVDLKGEIANGKPPYSYAWQLEDGTAVGAGTLNAPGELPLAQAVLPSVDSKGEPGSLTVRLVVTDDEGVTRQQEVSLFSPVSYFLPHVTRNSSVLGSASAGAPNQSAEAPTPNLLAINYSFGVEYGSDYPPYGAGGSDLGGVPPDANGFSSGMMGLGWPRIFNWYNANAWEKDWRDCSLGGLDCSWGGDRTDFVYYAGHGSNGGLSLPSNSHDSSWADGSNARFQRARWVGFASCKTLRAQWPTPGSEPIRKWFNAFQGAHMLLGFNSNMADVAFGPRLVDNMRMPSFPFIGELPWAQRTIAEAWVQTAFQMNAGKPAYIYATSVSVNPISNKLPKVTDAPMPRPYPVNWYYWVWWNE